MPHIVASSGALSSSTDATLTGWSCSVHEAFNAWPSSFQVIAIDKTTATGYTAPDGTVGAPYILTRGSGSGGGSGSLGGSTSGQTVDPSETLGGGNGSENNTQCSQGNYPVDCATGDFYHSFTDLAVRGRGPGLNLSRTYNSLAAASEGPFGYGWTSSYSMSVSVDATTANVTVHQEDGATVTFTPSTSGGYTAPQRVLASLSKNSDGSYTFVRRARQIFQFSSTGQLSATTDLNGYTTTLAQNSSGQLATVTDSAGRTLTVAYGANGLVSAVTDSAAHIVGYAYDANGNLTSVTDPSGNKTNFTYDANHLLLVMTDARGGAVTNTFDGSGRVLTQTDPAGLKTTFAYTASGTTITDPNGTVTVEDYTGGQLTSETKGIGTPAQATWSFTWGPTLGLTGVADPDGHVTHYSYDTNGNRTAIVDPLGRTTNFTFDELGNLTSTTDPAGTTTTIFYDAHGNPTSRTTPLSATQAATSTYSYDPTRPGDLVTITDPDGRTTHYTYDAAGDLTSATDPAGDTTTATYNTIGWSITTTAARGNIAGANASAFTTTIAYDADGRPTVATDPIGRTTTIAYDGDGNRTSVIDAAGQTTAYTYDSDNRLTATHRPNGTTLTSAYDGNGSITAQTDGLGHTTAYAWNALERLSTITDPLGRTQVFSYDPAGHRTALQDQTGATTSYSYDAASELTKISYSDGATPNVAYAYDTDGRRATMTTGTSVTGYHYDALGRLTSTTDGSGRILTYSYDLASQLTSVAYPSILGVSASTGTASVGAGTVTRTYDPAGRLATVTDWLAHTTSFGYDADGNLATQTDPNGTVGANSYNNADQLTSMVDTTTAAGAPFLNLPYGRDLLGRLSTDNPLGTAAPVNQTFSYDPASRLTGAAIPTAATSVPTESWAYNAADQITQITVGAASKSLSYDAAGQITSEADPIGTTNFSYDARGQRTRQNNPGTGVTTTYAWSQAGQLTTYSGPVTNTVNGQVGTNVQQISYSYDGDGLRTDLLWDYAEGSVPLVLQDGTTSYITGPGGFPIEQITAAGTPLYYHHDQLGSTRALTDQAGRVAASAAYDPYGNTIASTGTAINPIGWAGQYTDTQTGLIYLRARWYDPKTGQFISADPAGAITREPYAYGADGPTNNADPSGLDTHGYCVGGSVVDGVGGGAQICLVEGGGEVGLATTPGFFVGTPGADVLLQEQDSNAGNIEGLGGPFINAGISGGAAGVVGGADLFSSLPGSCPFVVGTDVGIGGGLPGVSVAGGATNTAVRVFSGLQADAAMAVIAAADAQGGAISALVLQQAIQLLQSPTQHLVNDIGNVISGIGGGISGAASWAWNQITGILP